ncbi:MAG: class I SAM-dependent methyltransferase [Spirochaetes bacterium]|nr:class I SAM-dependent methyltransferase [Spirochaetota bacterium]
MDYKKSDLDYWIKTTQRQYHKDMLFIKRIKKYFIQGSILELGAGCGQLSKLLSYLGLIVQASDINDFFIEYMISQSINAIKVDALDIIKYTKIKYDNIFCQGLSTLVTKDLSIVEKTYQSIYKALNDNGRAVLILPNGYNIFKWNKLKDHIEIIKKLNFKIFKIFRDQILPSVYYVNINPLVINFLENALGRFFGVRNVIVLEKINLGGYE